MRVLSASLVVLTILAIVVAPAEAGENGVIRTDNYRAVVGEQVTAVLGAIRIPEPGLDSWTVDIAYDNSILSAGACEAHENGVCSPAFMGDTVRTTGAHPTGIRGVFTLATYAFTCEAVGVSTLTISVSVPAQNAPRVIDGSVTCVEDVDNLTIGSSSLAIGQEAAVAVQAVAPGLGSWFVFVDFDRSILSYRGCDLSESPSPGQAGRSGPYGRTSAREFVRSSEPHSPIPACSLKADGIRVYGTSAEGLGKEAVLLRLLFRCVAVGSTELTPLIRTWSRAHIAVPQPVPRVDTQAGRVTCEEPGQDGVIRIGSYEAAVEDKVTAVLEAVDIPEPGLGVWTVDVTYDTSIVSLVECNAQLGGVCNPAHTEDTLRVTGASAAGLSGTATLANIVFVCNRSGTTDLEVVLSFGGIFLPDDPPSIPDPVSGTLTCAEPSSVLPVELPSTGVAKPQSGTPPATVPFAVLGAVLVAAAYAFRRYASLR